jgi:hypothetical protein
MSVLRYIDGDGRERVIDDVNHLFEAIKARQIQNNSLVWDEGECRWVTARDHEFFRRIREIAAASDAPTDVLSGFDDSKRVGEVRRLLSAKPAATQEGLAGAFKTHGLDFMGMPSTVQDAMVKEAMATDVEATMEYFNRIFRGSYFGVAAIRHYEERGKQFDPAKGSASPAAKDLAEIQASATTAESPASKFKAATESWATHEARNNKEPSQASREYGSKANVSEKPKVRWFKPIKNREEALITIKAISAVFFGLAGIQAIMGLAVAANNFQNPVSISAVLLIDPGLYVALASWLRWGRSRVAAVLLLLIALISLGVKTAAMFEPGGKVWLVSLIVFWAACKAVEATFKLPEFEKASALSTRSEPVVATRSERDDTPRRLRVGLQHDPSTVAWFFVIALFVIFAAIIVVSR